MIVITASFVAEPLQLPLSWLLNEAGISDAVSCAPYNQIFQQLLSPGSELAGNSASINIILVRLEDYVRDLPDDAAATITVERTASDLGAALESFTDRLTGSILLGVLSPDPGVPSGLKNAILEARMALISRARHLPPIQLLDERQIDALSESPRYDLDRDRLAHIPYSETYFAALALAITRRIHAIRVPPAKVLVLDCDNTLWRGVVGEDGIEGIEISEPFAALQDFAVAQQEKGILVCLASKNTETDVLEVLEKRTDMRLKAKHIVAHRVNWDPKPANVRALAAELNLGLDACVFLDDNPLECAQMRAELPQVIALQIPEEAEVPRFLEHLWMFDKLVTTAEDADRTRMYRENSARQAMESSAADIGQFLAALDLKIDIAAPTEDEWPRIEQLTLRTNQFNFTTRRRTALELKSLPAAAGASVLRVRVSDRFGDYGLVGVIIAAPEAGAMHVDTFLLSCRVLGRGVEHAMLRRVGDLAVASNLSEVALPYIATARNIPARAFADNVAAAFAGPADGGKVYRMPVAHAQGIAHAPGRDPAEVIEARAADEKKGLGSAQAGAFGRSERYSRLAHLVSGRAVIEQMSARPRRPRSIVGEAAPPTTAVEKKLLQLWEELLEVDGIGVDDDYFALGGTSLLSVQLFAEIGRRFDVSLRLTAILEAPTVRSLARLMTPSGVHQRGNVVCLRGGGSENFFFVHDGLGETLLYANLARRLPQNMSVYGVEPKRLPGIALAHGSMEEMARFYIEQIQKIQPHGPFLLGGMCAGGVIAYQMAASLRQAGEQVQLVAILDGATPQAPKRVGHVARRRLSRLESVLSQSGTRTAPLERAKSIVMSLARKASNVIGYEISAAATRMSVRLRFALLQGVVRRHGAWPAALPELSVLEIYNAIEARYIPPILPDVPVLLVRASAGEGTDTPYREFYRDEDLGWGRVARRLELVDVSGGHSSMLQEHSIDSIAGAMLKRLSVP